MDNSKTPPELLTLDEVAAELKVSYEQARKLIVNGKLAYVNAGCGQDRKLYRVQRETLNAFMRAEKRSSVRAEMDDAKRFVASQASAGDERW